MSLDIIPVPEEQEWLGNALRELLDRGARDSFAYAPILRPVHEHFPDPWSGTLADVHRLTQRLMHQAGLGKLRFTISGFDDAYEDAWDEGTAGWFSGIKDGRALFGVHLEKLKDPEAAIGVMGHEVAHAWRQQHGLITDDRDVEEILTDLTTIVLGFGIFTTNNADRYRSYGVARATYWSISSTGYLPPPAMAWLLAVQAFARGGEARAVGDDLEPNQQASFRAALYELGIDPSLVEALLLPNPPIEPRTYEPIEVQEPTSWDIKEPKYPAEAKQRNSGVTVHRLIKTGPGSMLIGLYLGAVVGLVLTWLVFKFEDHPGTLGIIAVCAIVGMFVVRRKQRLVCSDVGCGTTVSREMAVCPGCGGLLSGVVSERELARLREDELDRDSAVIPYEECDECEPENPCEKHA